MKKQQWDTDKVIDFVNWYLRSCKVITDSNCRFELENMEVINSFLNGDDYKLWWKKPGKEPFYKSKKLKQLEDILDSPLTDEEKLYIQDSVKLLEQESKSQSSDADLLQDIYDRNGMDVIANSDIYQQGFKDGLSYQSPGSKEQKADSDKFAL